MINSLLVAIAISLVQTNVVSNATSQIVTPVYQSQSYPEVSLSDVELFWSAKKGVIIDARPRSIYSRGHIPGALCVTPGYEFSESYASVSKQLEADKAQPIIVYCTNRWCGMSDALYTKLTGMGYTNVRVFRDGYSSWQAAKEPVSD